MHRAPLASLVAVALVTCVGAQAKPDLSGNWSIVVPNMQVARMGARAVDIGSPLCHAQLRAR